MLYIIDSDFGYIQHPNASLIYEVGTKATTNHGGELLRVIQSINAAETIELFDIGGDPSNGEIIAALNVLNECTPGTVLITWSMPFNNEIDDIITKLSDKFTFIVAGGNAKQDIHDLTPCSNSNAITVGSLNKSNEIASHNSKGHIDVFAPGTNIDVNGKKVSGTSIAAAIFTGYYTRTRNASQVQYDVTTDFDKIIHQKF